MQASVCGTSHAKIILMGEHSVIYGEPAIALPLPSVTTTATLIFGGEGQRLTSRYYQGLVSDLPTQMMGVAKLINALTAHFQGENDAWELVIESDLPAERGMGSSAATAVAIIRAFFAAYHMELSHSQLLKWANIEEEVTHRSPSGLDAATVSASATLFYVKGQQSQPIEMNLSATLVIADTGIKGATKKAIAEVKKRFDTHPEETRHRLNHMGQLVEETRIALSNNDLRLLGRAMDECQADLKFLGVSSKALDHLVTVAKQNGALGAKLTGGGRGGCMIALTATALGARKLAAVLKENGATATWIQPLKGDL